MVLGSDYADVTSPTELAFNAEIAANLNGSLLLVVSGHDRDAQQIRDAAETALNEFTAHHVQTIGVIANRVDAGPEGFLVSTIDLSRRRASSLS